MAAKSAKKSAKTAKKAAKSKSTAAKSAKPKAAPKAARAQDFEEVPMAAPSAAGAKYPDYPVIDQVAAIICLVVNVVLLPGVGTMIAGYLGKKPMILKGVLQLVLTFVLVGWVWAIISGVKILMNASPAAKPAA